MDNKGGKVIMNHAEHAALLNQNCSTCHHTSGEGPSPLPCESCHVKKFDETFQANHQSNFDESQCIACHHPSATIEKFSHEEHVTEYAADDCRACHHDESIEPEPQACSDCRDKTPSGSTPSLRDATHERCADCHSDFYQEGAKGCSNCHTRKPKGLEEGNPQACSSCHAETTDTLIPTKTNAFHSQCMQCHEKQGKGPFGDDACYQCHMK